MYELIVQRMLASLRVSVTKPAQSLRTVSMGLDAPSLKLVGHGHFKRVNPKSDLFKVLRNCLIAFVNWTSRKLIFIIIVRYDSFFVTLLRVSSKDGIN